MELTSLFMDTTILDLLHIALFHQIEGGPMFYPTALPYPVGYTFSRNRLLMIATKT